ncbi:hypothetical protein F7725_023034 [Dissostichus mawsoni]|uniref:Uncharacterized protein n=1 Tax=Dissostichus mawsoni TaxID=36200 RepID=A0A7J5Z1Q4_DISMA|nr:hypothetical protein F7725_023034 [Dissostichus mawsoni]
MDYSKAQMSSFTEEGNSAGFPPPGNAGVKLEAVMEQLQRQQEAKLGMNLQEKHLLHAQLLFAQHAAAARASGSRLDPALFGKADGQTYLAAQQAYNSRIDPDEEDEDSDEEEQEMVGLKGMMTWRKMMMKMMRRRWGTGLIHRRRSRVSSRFLASPSLLIPHLRRPL